MPPRPKWLFATACSLGFGILIAGITGSTSALLLVTLDRVTEIREFHPWLIYLLPAAGFLVGCIYHFWGRGTESGHHLIVDEIHDPKEMLPARMAPFILVGTWLTHLFGGSAGREGTAVQMGAALADRIGAPFKLDHEARRILILCGISAGFASVFGTPWAGAVFGLEVMRLGRHRIPAALPCFLSAMLAHQVTLRWGIHHTVYDSPTHLPGPFPGLIFATLAGILFGLTARGFITLTHLISSFFEKKISFAPLRPFIGGVILILAVYFIGNARYLGLGVPVIVESFQTSLPPRDFLLKLLFTSITLGSGFKGGEVTPLFFIGASLGSALSSVIPLPFNLLSALGFVAVFGSAAKTPFASTVMAFELFGPGCGIYAGIACVSANLCSSQKGIYHPRRHLG